MDAKYKKRSLVLEWIIYGSKRRETLKLRAQVVMQSLFKDQTKLRSIRNDQTGKNFIKNEAKRTK